MTPPPTMTGDEPDAMAAELALRLLEGEERATALRRMLADPDFAAELARWRDRFALWFDAWPEVAAPADGLARLEATIFGAPQQQRSSVRLWQGLAALSGLVAACLLLFVAMRGPEIALPSPLLTTIVANNGAGPIAALYDPATGRLSLDAANQRRAGRSAQLWIIGADGVPHSLGLMADRGATRLALSPALRDRMRVGATIAISIEPVGGSPGPLPTGPVVATGAWTPV